MNQIHGQMVNQLGRLVSLSSPCVLPTALSKLDTCPLSKAVLKSSRQQRSLSSCSGYGGSRRRRVRYDGGEDENDGSEGYYYSSSSDEYGYNEEIGILETYSQSAKEEALIVNALVDEEQVQLLIFKGFSSSLSYGTSPDPSRSVIPARAVIKWIDRVKGPFDPSNVEYLEKRITWDAFRSRLPHA